MAVIYDLKKRGNFLIIDNKLLGGFGVDSIHIVNVGRKVNQILDSGVYSVRLYNVRTGEDLVPYTKCVDFSFEGVDSSNDPTEMDAFFAGFVNPISIDGVVDVLPVSSEQLPESLGSKPGESSLSVVMSSDSASTPYRLISEIGLNENKVKEAPGILNFVYATNVSGDARFVKIYDKTAIPDPGVDIPKITLRIAGNGVVDFDKSKGIIFENGISILISSDIDDNGTGPVDAGEVILSIGYN